jgi:hypothetical protein
MHIRLLSLALLLGFASDASAQVNASQPREFMTLVAHWAEYADPEYLPFLAAARPDVAQVGFYGAHFWSLAHTPHGQGYPAHFPLVGLQENRDWLANLNREIHGLGIKVVGHINVKFLVGDPDSPPIPATKKAPAEPGGPRGFFKFYRELWDEKLLGPKPVADPLELLEIDADGKPITNNNYSIGGMKEYWGCLNNPHWRSVLKAWTKHGIELGCDGFMINYFYRHNCLCPHCVSAFKNYLGERFTAEELNHKFQIGDLKTHRFSEIVSWHKAEESTPLRREMLRFSQIANKRAFDEVFVKYGRSLKPDLIVGQWNHLGNFKQLSGDERCLLPADLWGRDENYLWYSTGSEAFFTDLAEGILGEGTLQARFIRGMFGNRPFTLGKYESTRTRVAIAELAANCGAPMGFYTRFKDPAARDEIVRYYQFLRRHEDIFRWHQPAHDSVLLFPRRAIHDGDLRPLARFREIGTRWLDEHVLFDIHPDDAVTPELASRYRQIVSVEAETPQPPSIGQHLIEAPKTVRVSLTKHPQRDEFALHFVNYNREEPEQKRSAGRGIQDEKPIPVEGVRVALQWPGGKVNSVEFLTPENDEPVELDVAIKRDRLTFVVPKFLVYGVVRLR